MNQRIFTDDKEILNVAGKHFYVDNNGVLYEIKLSIRTFVPIAKLDTPVMLSTVAKIIKKHYPGMNPDFRWLGAD